jgi:hypothetical protein
MRTFVRGSLWILLFYFLIDTLSDHYSRTFLYLAIVTFLLITIKKKTKQPEVPASKELSDSQFKDVYYLRQSLTQSPTEIEMLQLARAIAASSVLGNIYPVDGELELRLTTNYDSHLVDSKFQFFGRIGSGTFSYESNTDPYSIFESICIRYYAEIDPSFLKVMVSFGWFGMDMGNRPPLTLIKIEEASADLQHRTFFKEKIEGYKIPQTGKNHLEEIWNSQCEFLAEYISNDKGMMAIRAREPMWLTYF